MLPTDTQKNTAFAFAKEHGVEPAEDYAIALADGCWTATPTATGAQVRVEEYAWDRIAVDGAGHDHAFVRRGTEIRTCDRRGAAGATSCTSLSGLTDLVVLKSTGSEFKGFLQRPSSPPCADTDDRVLATSLTAAWRSRTATRTSTGTRRTTT